MFLGVEELALCVAAVINLGICLYVFLTNPRDPSRRAFVIFVGGISLWVGGFFLLGVTLHFDFHLRTQFEGLTGTIGLFLFAELFPRSPKLPIRSWMLYAPFAVAVLGIMPWRYIVLAIRLLIGGEYLSDVGALSPGWAILAGGYAFVCIWLLVVHHVISRGGERTQELQKSREDQRRMILDIAHGLQTPLAILQTKLEKLKLLNSREIDVDTFETSLIHVSDFIENLLKFAQLEHRIDEPNLERCSLSDMVEEIAEEVGIIALPRGIHVACHAEPCIDVSVDKKKLGSAIMNLGCNSIKYMRATGERNISFELRIHAKDARLSVRDTGVGIAGKDLPHIFDRFYRVEDGRGIPGNGLGLSISKKIIELHRGTLTVDSTLGEGTIMHITIPIVK